MTKGDVIKEFANERPTSRGVYGYGSNVFKQASVDTQESQTDVIFIVDDLREWHQVNMEWNPKDYSFLGRMHLNRKAIDKIKGKNNITYFSHIQGEVGYFKYGVIEINDFICSLSTWNNLFVVGRFQKPTLEVYSERRIRESIQYNRECALLVASLFANRITTKWELYSKLCGLSYAGDARMLLAENPNKVANIVAGSYKLLKKLYPLNQDYLIELGEEKVLVRYDVLLKHIADLPVSLLMYLDDLGTDFSDLEMVRKNIGTYFYEHNKTESRAQIMEGFKTNGVVRSVPYVVSKVKKRFCSR